LKFSHFNWDLCFVGSSSGFVTGFISLVQ